MPEISVHVSTWTESADVWQVFDPIGLLTVMVYVYEPAVDGAVAPTLPDDEVSPLATVLLLGSLSTPVLGEPVVV